MTKQDLVKVIKNNNQNIARIKKDNLSSIKELINYADEMPDVIFWKIIKQLNIKIKQGINNYGKIKGISAGIHNLFCDVLINNEKQLSFIYEYQNKVNNITDDNYEHLANFSFFGDDGWYDFTDSLPLAGKVLYDDILNNTITEDVFLKSFCNISEKYILSQLIDKLILFIE